MSLCSYSIVLSLLVLVLCLSLLKSFPLCDFLYSCNSSFVFFYYVFELFIFIIG